MTVFDTIRNRRSIYEFKSEPVPREVIARVLETAVWAPNHKLTEPWRFLVVTGKTKEYLAEIYCKIQRKKTKSDDTGILRKATEKGYAKIMSKPVVIGVVCKKDEDDFRAREDYAATCCAIHNISLAAWEEGIGMQWSTGGLIRDPDTLRLLNIDPQVEEIIGFLYTGYPSQVPAQKRVPASERTEWFI